MNFLNPKLYIVVIITTLLTVISCTDRPSEVYNEELQRTITFENLSVPKDFVESGSFSEANNIEIFPGQSTTINFSAGKTQSLMLATMYGASKDWFFASKQPGIKLFDDNGNAIIGDVSSEILLWDNGTKNNTTGAIENNPVQLVEGINASKLMRAQLDFNKVTSVFTLTLTNTSKGTDHETAFSPGVWAISNFNGKTLLNTTPFFTAGETSNSEITDIAEKGNITKMLNKLETQTGIMTTLSPALVVVYKGSKNPIFQVGTSDYGLGLKDIAQRGDATTLKNELLKMSNVTSVTIIGNAPLSFGQKASATVAIQATEKIAYVTMFGSSNDWFFANQEPIDFNQKGDISSITQLYDSGTGIDQYPGAGNNQTLFGGIPTLENKAISTITKNYPVPNINKIIKVNIQ